jgi:hypothetical protein
VASPARCGARKYMFFIGCSGPSTRRI